MRMHIFRWLAVFVLVPFALASRADEAAATVKKLQVTILSTMVVDYIGENEGLGEWGFAALIEADGRKILFDTGAHPDTVLHNAKALGLDLSGVTDVVLSHFHNDHTGGLLALRRELRKANPHAMERAHIGHEFFWLRRADGRVWDQTIQLRKTYLEMGGVFVEHLHAEQLFPGIWVTGEIARRTDEHNFSKGVEVQSPDGNWVEDDVRDEISLVINTNQGPVVITGCGHAGIVNTLQAVSENISKAPVDAVIGGLHLFTASDEHVDWTAVQMRRFGVKHLIGAHCTGPEALVRLRTGLGLNRSTAKHGAVGQRFTNDQGIDEASASLVR